jgi:hypothetical protein
MASGSIPRIRSAVPGALTVNNNNTSTTGLPTDGAQFLAYVVTFTSLAAGSSIIIKLQECDTVGGTYTDVTGGALPALTAASDNDTSVIIFKATGRQAFTRINVANSAAFATVMKSVHLITTGLSTEAVNANGTAVSGTNVKFV